MSDPMIDFDTDAFDQTGRVAVVTGGGTGIGRATALLFATYGADVVLASRKRENLERVATEVREATGRRSEVAVTDVRDVEQCEQLIDETIERLGRIDVLVNNAGGSHTYPFESWTPDRFQNMIDLNLRSTFVLSHRVAPHMTERGSGAIVNVSSGAAAIGLPDVAPYGAAKSGVENLTQSFAAALTPHGIRVNCVRVGAIKSEGFLRAMEKVGTRSRQGRGPRRGDGSRGMADRDRVADPVPGLRGVELRLRPDALRRRRSARPQLLTRQSAHHGSGTSSLHRATCRVLRRNVRGVSLLTSPRMCCSVSLSQTTRSSHLPAVLVEVLGSVEMREERVDQLVALRRVHAVDALHVQVGDEEHVFTGAGVHANHGVTEPRCFGREHVIARAGAL